MAGGAEQEQLLTVCGTSMIKLLEQVWTMGMAQQFLYSLFVFDPAHVLFSV